MPEEAPAARARPKVLLAFDFGMRRIGVACGDTVSGNASPLGSVTVGPAGVRWDRIDALMRDYRPALLIVGLPYNTDGSESDAARRARGFAAELAAHYALPVDLVDERYSSLEAEARLKDERAAGLRRRRVTKSDVDAGAACVILERWLGRSGLGEDT